MRKVNEILEEERPAGARLNFDSVFLNVLRSWAFCQLSVVLMCHCVSELLSRHTNTTVVGKDQSKTTMIMVTFNFFIAESQFQFLSSNKTLDAGDLLSQLVIIISIAAITSYTRS